MDPTARFGLIRLAEHRIATRDSRLETRDSRLLFLSLSVLGRWAKVVDEKSRK